MGNETSTCSGEHCLLSSSNSKDLCKSISDNKDKLDVAVQPNSGESKPMSYEDQKAHDIIKDAMSKIKKEIDEELAKDALFRTNFDKRIRMELEVNPRLVENIADTSVKGRCNYLEIGYLCQSMQAFLQTRHASACTTIEDVEVCSSSSGSAFITLVKKNRHC